MSQKKTYTELRKLVALEVLPVEMFDTLRTTRFADDCLEWAYWTREDKNSLFITELNQLIARYSDGQG